MCCLDKDPKATRLIEYRPYPVKLGDKINLLSLEVDNFSNRNPSNAATVVKLVNLEKPPKISLLLLFL